MFERFTDRARRVVVLAQEEARSLGHNYIGTEHILLGIVREGEGVGAKALESLDIPLAAVRAGVEQVVGRGSGAAGFIPFTARAKTVLELSLREALQLGHNHIGTEHILLGLLSEGEGVGARVLVDLGAGLSRVRAEVVRLLSGHSGGRAEARTTGPTIQFVPSSGPGIATPPGRSCSFCGRDFWEIERYVVGSSAVICDGCIEAAREAVARAPTAGEREVHLPPRVFGDPPPTADTVREIERAVRAVFTGNEDDCRQHLEDGDRLAPLRVEAAARVPATRETSAHLDRVRFGGGATADIRFTLRLSGEPGPVVEGAVVVRDGRWQLTRDTFCQVMAMAGVQCPPLEPPAS